MHFYLGVTDWVEIFFICLIVVANAVLGRGRCDLFWFMVKKSQEEEDDVLKNIHNPYVFSK